ncbi:MAG: septum site-determining protein MinD, partial [Candidatus Aenigmatarchaeota archaeon]
FMNSISDVIKCNKVAKYLNLKPLGIVLNMYRKDLNELDESDVEELTELKVLAKIPFDLNVQKSLIYRMPVVIFDPYSPASIEIERLAAYLIGKEYKPPKGKFFYRIFKLFRK